MKKMTDPVREAEKIIEAYVGAKPIFRKQKKIPRGKGVLFLSGGAGLILAGILIFYF